MFRARNRPTEPTIRRLSENFEVTGLVVDRSIPTSVDYDNIMQDGKNIFAREGITENFNFSILRRPQLGILRTSVSYLLHKIQSWWTFK